jgi:hypothetical protein
MFVRKLIATFSFAVVRKGVNMSYSSGRPMKRGEEGRE